MRAMASGSLRAVAHLVYSARRRSKLSAPRLGSCTALVAVSIVAGGLLAVLLVFFTLVLVVDAVLPMPGHTWSEADDRFSRLVRQRRRAHLQRRLRRLGPDGLDVLDDRSGWAAVAERRALGVESIPLDSISGTVESMKARSFDRRFRPERSSSEHWKRLWIAQARGAALPPISVYRVEGGHVVRDGHHRVSVALDRGMSAIDADVVELLQSGGVGRVGRAVVRPSHPHMPATDAETSDARAVARRFIDLFNARDHDALCEVIAEDAEFSTVGGEPRRGPDGARDLLRVAEERDLRLVPLRPGEVEEDDGRVRVTLPVRELIGPDDIERVAELEIRDGRVAVFALRKMV